MLTQALVGNMKGTCARRAGRMGKGSGTWSSCRRSLACAQLRHGPLWIAEDSQKVLGTDHDAIVLDARRFDCRTREVSFTPPPQDKYDQRTLEEIAKKCTSVKKGNAYKDRQTVKAAYRAAKLFQHGNSVEARARSEGKQGKNGQMLSWVKLQKGLGKNCAKQEEARGNGRVTLQKPCRENRTNVCTSICRAFTRETLYRSGRKAGRPRSLPSLFLSNRPLPGKGKGKKRLVQMELPTSCLQ